MIGFVLWVIGAICFMGFLIEIDRNLKEEDKIHMVIKYLLSTVWFLVGPIILYIIIEDQIKYKEK